MSIDNLQKQTNINVREKANLIWEIATHLYGEYKPHEYGRVILPMTVIKRFDDSLKKTKEAVLQMAKVVDEKNVIGVAKEAILKKTSGYDFYNISKFDFKILLSDPENIASNFAAYLQGFSDNVKDIIARFEFDKEISKMTENDLLYTIINEFNSKKADMSPDIMTSQDMGYIFEELIRKFSESYDEQAGAHFTSRDIIYLMTELLIAPEKEVIKVQGCNKTAYDMTMGTSQMLACLDEKLKEINEQCNLMCFGQEFNPETYAIAKSDMLIKGKNAENMKFGDTLSNDQFPDATFDYIISNPPFGIDWKKEKDAVEKEFKLGYDGRFGPGLPSIGDGQLLFMLNGVKKLKNKGRMAIIQNGSSLFNGDAGSGQSEIRKYLIENDMVDCIIQLPNDLFYNTGISTYIWLITKNKDANRKNQIQLIDASKCYIKRRKNIGSKRVELDETCIDMILQVYKKFETNVYEIEGLNVESKVFNNIDFGYTKIIVETPIMDEETGEIVFKKGKIQADVAKRDTEVIPLNEDVNKYFIQNVIPYNKHAFIDHTKTKVGYEIPFTRLFYKFDDPILTEDILAEIKELEAEETILMKELFGDE